MRTSERPWAPEEGDTSVSILDKLDPRPDADTAHSDGLHLRIHQASETSADMALST